MTNEIWKDVVGYEGLYKVSNMGRVKHIDGRLYPSKPQIYACVNLKKDNLITRTYTHRMVMVAFVPNPENKKTVNHKNLDTTDQRLENLEWCTYKENTDHWIKNKKRNLKMTDEKLIQTPVGLTETQRKHASRFGNLSAFIRSLIDIDLSYKGEGVVLTGKSTKEE